MEYWQLLKRPEWQKKRLEMLELAGWECQDCGSKENSLHVHHKQYFKGRDPWDYEADQLEVLCDDCHNVEHLELQRIKEILSFYSVNEIYNLLIG
jgi:5-methylcytosine-specific restriction endonuclease McrA